jgi:hypothetical protein
MKRWGNMISRHANIIKRHRNPVGIFSRALIYLLIGVGAWRHRLDLVAAEAALEAMLWTAEPSVGRRSGSWKTPSRKIWVG